MWTKSRTIFQLTYSHQSQSTECALHKYFLHNTHFSIEVFFLVSALIFAHRQLTRHNTHFIYMIYTMHILYYTPLNLLLGLGWWGYAKREELF